MIGAYFRLDAEVRVRGRKADDLRTDSVWAKHLCCQSVVCQQL